MDKDSHFEFDFIEKISLNDVEMTREIYFILGAYSSDKN